MTELSTIRWDIDIVALSSIVHREDYSSIGTDNFALFRREKIITPEGSVAEVPIVSGASFRGVLRRIGEQLTATVLNYEASLPVPAAHLLTNGGRLAKSARPISDEAERQLKTLLPQVAIFGGAASGRIMSGLLTVGKVLPEVAELVHILPRPPHQGAAPPAVLSVAEESFTHLDDHRRPPPPADMDTTAGPPVDLDDPATNTTTPPQQSSRDDRPPTRTRTERRTKTSPLGRYGIETLPAGTRLQTWAQLTNATDFEIAYFTSILAEFSTRGHLGGRIASGHGQLRAATTPTVLRGHHHPADTDWATPLAQHREQAIAALTDLT